MYLRKSCDEAIRQVRLGRRHRSNARSGPQAPARGPRPAGPFCTGACRRHKGIIGRRRCLRSLWHRCYSCRRGFPRGGSAHTASSTQSTRAPALRSVRHSIPSVRGVAPSTPAQAAGTFARRGAAECQLLPDCIYEPETFPLLTCRSACRLWIGQASSHPDANQRRAGRSGTGQRGYGRVRCDDLDY